MATLALALAWAAPAGAADRRSVKRLAPGLTWTKVVRSAGPLRFHVLTIDRARLSGRVAAVLSNRRVAGRERPSAMARRARALAGVNGGYFAAGGDPVGALVARGRLVSEPVAPRAALLVPSDRMAPASVAGLRFSGSVTLGGRTRLLDGIDRAPGRIPACGGRGGDRPTQAPNSVLTCTDASELILFDSAYGARRPAGGAELRVPGGAVLWGSGDAAAFLRRGAGSTPAVHLGLRSGARRVEAAAHDAIVGGGPRLLRGGLVRVGSLAEGFAPAGAPSFFTAFVVSPNPRTLAGVRSDGRLLLVTVDGRRRGWSTGLSLAAAARLMRSLGARDALNLDGGGSTAMAVGGRVVSRPSDRAGERPVSDGLFVLP